ncbi:MAG: metal-dependent hydrolase [Planctomycetes bacterium]|nr:metal-dependent hydrolase [Planctomycetota bacterium]
MDNLTHTLFATALGKSALGRRSSLAPWAMAVAANLPDADALARVLGKEAYLTHHRGLTHSLVGLAIQVPLVAGLFAWADRRTREQEGARAAFWALLPGVAAALASHLALDALNPYGIRPWLPFDGSWIYGDLAFIADPWQWLLFGGATALAGARSKSGSWALGLAAVGCAAVIGASGRAPSWGLGVFIASAVLLAYLRGRGVGRSQPQRVLAIFGLFAAVYLTLLSITGGLAVQAAVGDVRSLNGGASAEQTAAMAEPMDPLDWTVLIQSGERIYRRRLHLGTGNSEGSSFPTMLTDSRVAEAAATAAGQAWREFARHPYATVEPQADGSVVVTLLDARYPGIGFCTFPVTLGKK